MKKIYLLTLLAIAFSFNGIIAQTACPEGGFVVGTAPDQQIILTFDPAGPACGSRPAGIFANAGNDSAYVQDGCDSNYVIYDLIVGPGVADPSNFVVSYDGSTCTYTDNLLPTEKIALINSATLKMYPNPVSANQDLRINFAINTSAKINVFDITGKSVLSDSMDNSNSKKINVSSLSNGVYMMQMIMDGGSQITRKFVITK